MQVKLGAGVVVGLEESKDASVETLAMLAAGVAYACASGAEQLVQSQYQQVGRSAARAGLVLPASDLQHPRIAHAQRTR